MFHVRIIVIISGGALQRNSFLVGGRLNIGLGSLVESALNESSLIVVEGSGVHSGCGVGGSDALNSSLRIIGTDESFYIVAKLGVVRKFVSEVLQMSFQFFLVDLSVGEIVVLN